MKTVRFLSILFVFLSLTTKAQKIGIVDTDYILNKLPQYKEAQDRLDKMVQQWQTEIQTLQQEYDAKKATLENERVLLVGDQLKQREKEVADLDKKIKNILATKFGNKGEINNARANLAKPYQDQIWNAIKTISEKNSLGIVLDKNENNVLFLEKRYDYTEKVLNLLLKNKPEEKTDKKSKGSPTNNSPMNNNMIGRPVDKDASLKARQKTKNTSEDVKTENN